MNKYSIAKEVEEAVLKGTRVVITGHMHPDGDAIGAVTGMQYFLQQLGKESSIILPDCHPHYLQFLTDSENPPVIYEDDSRLAEKLIKEANLIICLDFNRLSRISQMADLVKKSNATKILIDHHISPEIEEFDVVVSQTDVSSTCELLLHQILQFDAIAGDIMRLNMKSATSLLAGILTDTNNFSNSIFPATLTSASKLLQRGVDRDWLYQNIFCSYSEERMRLMGEMLLRRMKIIPEYGAAYMLLSDRLKKSHNFNQGDSEGFVNLPLAIGNIKMSALFTEDAEHGYLRVSIRSKGDLDVNSFCNRYCNGGGHKNASGGKLYMKLAAVPAYFEKCLKEFFTTDK
ncbi:MAG: DHH family phosphoesterase [Bacteroidales bacterium]|nr:DHH family phosphoesterase [Bacteroidales bacterium]